MHDFFDKLGAAAKRAASNVANEVSVAAEKQKLSDAYKDLGKRYYQAVKAGQTPDLTAEIAAIDAALARIDALPAAATSPMWPPRSPQPPWRRSPSPPPTNRISSSSRSDRKWNTRSCINPIRTR